LSERTKKKGVKSRNEGLKMMNFHVPPELYRRFKLRVLRERVTVRAVANAFLTAYVKGEFELEEKRIDVKEG
jgi:hypothetical protein